MLTGWLLLFVAIFFSTVLWPVGRWGLERDGRGTVMGFWISLTMGLVSLGGYLLHDATPPRGQVWIAGILMGIAYSIGFCALIMNCLKLGPAGPTVTVNNLAMACGVLYEVLFLRRAGMPPLAVLGGAAGTCAALVLIGMTQPDSSRTPVSPRWLPMVLAGGAFSGLSFVTQTYIGHSQRDHGFAYLMIGSFSSAVILLPVFIAQPALWKRHRERTAGVIMGAMCGGSVRVTLAAFGYFGAAVILPFTVVTPVVLVMLIGHYVYREHVSRPQAAGCVLAIVSLLLLTWGGR